MYIHTVKAEACSTAVSCNECYGIPNCTWCSDPNFTPTEVRMIITIHVHTLYMCT